MPKLKRTELECVFFILLITVFTCYLCICRISLNYNFQIILLLPNMYVYQDLHVPSFSQQYTKGRYSREPIQSVLVICMVYTIIC